ncbi:hypothetical protein LDENG_00214440 [Lucifuga dentata]|nr:hypothetical protein LDENG_00214440 [Lucifuga dentata]
MFLRKNTCYWHLLAFVLQHFLIYMSGKLFIKELTLKLKDHTTSFACLNLTYSIFIHVTLLTIISQSILLER